MAEAYLSLLLGGEYRRAYPSVSLCLSGDWPTPRPGRLGPGALVASRTLSSLLVNLIQRSYRSFLPCAIGAVLVIRPDRADSPRAASSHSCRGCYRGFPRLGPGPTGAA